MNGLRSSKVLVLLVSEAGIENISNADRTPDNVLIEYEFALELAEQKKVQLYIILSGSTFTAEVNGKPRKVYSEFKFPDLSFFPDKRHVHKWSGNITVRETMKRLFMLQGDRLDLTKSIDIAVQGILKKLSVRVILLFPNPFIIFFLLFYSF